MEHRFNPNSTPHFYTHKMADPVLSVCSNSRYAGGEAFFFLPPLSGLTMVPSGMVPERVRATWSKVVWYLSESRHSYNRLVLISVTGVIVCLLF